MPVSLTVQSTAERYAVTDHTVLAWIKSKELRAVNVARGRGKRPTWRITPEALEAFELLRTPSKPAEKTQRQKPAGTRKYY